MRHIWTGVVLFAALASLGAIGACQGSPAAPPKQANGTVVSPVAASGFASGLYWRPAGVAGQRWAMLLPGASGLTIFEDSTHYFRAADALNARGYDVLVVDYKRAYKESPDRPDVPTGRKIAWVIERAVDWARREGRVSAGEPGVLVAWSLGAEGLWPLLGDKAKLESLGVRAAAAYYPANEENAPISTTIPLLLMTGEADDVTPLAELKKSLAVPVSPLVQLRTYPGAKHGFDIVSIQPERTVRLLPLIGPSGTFGYNAGAAAEAAKSLEMFVDEHAAR